MTEDQKYFIYDIETGYPTPVSKEVWERWRAGILQMWESARPKLEGMGRIIIFGTGGDIDGANDYEKLFMNPENYNLVKYEPEKD